MRELCHHVIMQFRLPNIAFRYLLGRICCQTLGSLAYCACYTVQLISSNTHPPKLLTRSGCLSAPFRLLACPSSYLPDSEVACLPLRQLAGFRGCLPVLSAACHLSPRVIRGIPLSGCSLMFESVC